MATPSPIRDVLLAIAEAIRIELLRGANENGRFPLRSDSKLARTLKTEVKQGRRGSGQFAGYTANSELQVYAEFYAVYLDSGRKAFTKKVPLSALIQFIKNRRLRWKHKKTGRFLSLNSMAFLIQNAIYRKGIRGRNFIQPAFDVGQNLVEIYLDNQFLDGLTYELDRELLAL